jgi:cytochrome c biogenesis protein CcmG/thiol:disulfide interchange protein DsbE
VVGVDVLDVTTDAQAFLKEFGVTYPQLRDADGSKLPLFEIRGYPETIVLDRRGRIAATARGVVDERFFTERVQPLLKEGT